MINGNDDKRRKMLAEQANKYIELGYSLIPVSRDKRPLVSWSEYQERRASLEEVEGWIRSYPDVQFAVVTGKVSGIV